MTRSMHMSRSRCSTHVPSIRIGGRCFAWRRSDPYPSIHLRVDHRQRYYRSMVVWRACIAMASCLDQHQRAGGSHRRPLCHATDPTGTPGRAASRSRPLRRCSCSASASASRHRGRSAHRTSLARGRVTSTRPVYTSAMTSVVSTYVHALALHAPAGVIRSLR